MSAPALVEVHTVPTTEKEPERKARLNKPRWEPKRWHPVYEEVVLMDALGYSNIEIAADKGFTVVHISNILCTPQARMIKQLIIGQIEKKRVLTIDGKLNKMAEKAVGRMEEVLDDDQFATKNPGGMFDRALKLLQVTGKVKDPEVGIVRDRTLVIPSDVFARFTDAMMQSKEERKELNAGTGENFVTVKG